MLKREEAFIFAAASSAWAAVEWWGRGPSPRVGGDGPCRSLPSQVLVAALSSTSSSSVAVGAGAVPERDAYQRSDKRKKVPECLLPRPSQMLDPGMDTGDFRGGSDVISDRKEFKGGDPTM